MIMWQNIGYNSLLRFLRTLVVIAVAIGVIVGVMYINSATVSVTGLMESAADDCNYDSVTDA